MPYIIPEDRQDFYNDFVEKLIKQLIKNSVDNGKIPDSGDGTPMSGDVNYCITRIVNSLCPQPRCYDDINTAIGVLECAKLELYRRVAVPYENLKKTQNGDIKEYMMKKIIVDSVDTLDQNFH